MKKLFTSLMIAAAAASMAAVPAMAADDDSFTVTVTRSTTGGFSNGTSAIYFNTFTTSGLEHNLIINCTGGINQNRTQDFLCRTNSAQQSITFALTENNSDYYISAIAVQAMSGYASDNVTIGLDGVLDHNITGTGYINCSWTDLPYNGSNPVLNYKPASGNKSAYIAKFEITFTKISTETPIDVTKVNEAIAAAETKLDVMAASIPSISEYCQEMKGQIRVMSAEEWVGWCDGIDNAIAEINKGMDEFVHDVEMALPELLADKNITLQNIRRRGEFLCINNAYTGQAEFNSKSEIDQTCVFSFEATDESLNLYNAYGDVYVGPSVNNGAGGTYCGPVLKEQAIGISLKVAANGRLTLVIPESRPYLCFDTGTNPLATWSYDAGCDWAAQLTDITVTRPETTQFDLIVTPAEGEVEAISDIFISAPESVSMFRLNPDCAEALTVKTGETTIFSATTEEMAEPENGTYNVPLDATEAGTYTLTIPAAFFVGSMAESNPVEISWTIKEVEIDDALTEISAAAAAAPVYDILGRRVAAPVRGLYIQGGQKVIR